MADSTNNRYLPQEIAKKITQLISGESDRGTILILGAYLEELLGEVIRSYCISEEHADHILKFGQPAGNFSSKIALCSALGLIHQNETNGLTALRKIRNGAAHFDKSGQGFDVLFDSDKTIDQVTNLALSQNLERPQRESDVIKDVFIISCRLLATKILLRSIETVKPSPPLSSKEKADKIREQWRQHGKGAMIDKIDELVKNKDISSLSEFLESFIENK